MSIFTSFNVNASGMTAQRYRMDIISENVANMNTTRTEDGTPYRRKVVTFEEKGPKQGTFSSIFGTASDRYKNQGVKVSSVKEDTWTQMNMVYDPSHPDADENGYVTYPNVNVVAIVMSANAFGPLPMIFISLTGCVNLPSSIK